MFMNRFSNFWGKSVCALMVSVPLFYACSSDSGSTSNEEGDEVLFSSSSGVTKKSSSSGAVTDAEQFDVSKFNLEADGKVSTADGKIYNTVAVGTVTWIMENMNSQNPLEVKSTCFNYDDSNCGTYGRLYMENDYSSAASVCPDGYTIPSIGAWTNLLKSGVDFEPVFAGVCFKRDTLECDGLKKQVRYLADDDLAIVFTKDSSGKVTHSIQSQYDSYFYSLRCVKYRSIVKKFKDLPYCDSTYGNMPSIYVVERDSSYYCSYRNQEWYAESTTNMPCRFSEKGDFFPYDSTLLKCNGERWRLADIFDVDEPCTEKTLYKEYTLNGNRFACTEDGWIKLSYPGSILGYCHKEVDGSIGHTDSLHTYICRDNAWAEAYVEDVLGKCSTNVKDDIVEFNSTKYMCNGQSWRKETTVDSALGFCTAAMQDSVRIFSSRHYLCSNYEWYHVDSKNYLGKCDSTTMWDTVMVGLVVYVCNGLLTWQEQTYSNTVGPCTDNNIGEIKPYFGKDYICKRYSRTWEWELCSVYESMFGLCESSSDYRTIVTDSLVYRCTSSGWSSRAPTLEDYIGTCTSKTGEVIDTTYDGVEYICDTTSYNQGWFTPTPLDSAYGYCRTALLGEVHALSDTTEVVCEVSGISRKLWTIRAVGDE